MVGRPEDYRWSSYRATAGLARAPEWLALETLAPFFGEPSSWQANYRAWVAEKIGSDEGTSSRTRSIWARKRG